MNYWTGQPTAGLEPPADVTTIKTFKTTTDRHKATTKGTQNDHREMQIDNNTNKQTDYNSHKMTQSKHNERKWPQRGLKWPQTAKKNGDKDTKWPQSIMVNVQGNRDAGTGPKCKWLRPVWWFNNINWGIGLPSKWGRKSLNQKAVQHQQTNPVRSRQESKVQ